MNREDWLHFYTSLGIVVDVQNGGGAAAGKRRKLPVAAKEVGTLGELLAISDVVTLHCEITSDTVQLINEEALHSMKQGQQSSRFSHNFELAWKRSQICKN